MNAGSGTVVWRDGTLGTVRTAAGPQGESAMNATRQTLIAACLVASTTVMVAPAAAGGANVHRCCGWFPHWVPGGYDPVPAYPPYSVGPLSGAAYCCQTRHRRLGWYEYYYGPRN